MNNPQIAIKLSMISRKLKGDDFLCKFSLLFVYDFSSFYQFPVLWGFPGPDFVET